MRHVSDEKGVAGWRSTRKFILKYSPSSKAKSTDIIA